jgi:predicted Ser/Thr protein kinase
MKFELSQEEEQKYLEWKKSLPKLENGHFGAIGGGTVFEFRPTGLGTIITVRREDNPKHTITLSSFEKW